MIVEGTVMKTTESTSSKVKSINEIPTNSSELDF